MRAVFFAVWAVGGGCNPAGRVADGTVGTGPVAARGGVPVGGGAGGRVGSDGPLRRILPPATEARTVEGRRLPTGAASAMIGAGAPAPGAA